MTKCEGDILKETKILHDMFGMMFRFMQMGKKSSNYQQLYDSCENLWHMMCQKTAGQNRANNKNDISFDNLERFMSEICIESLVLYCNGELKRLVEEEKLWLVEEEETLDR